MMPMFELFGVQHWLAIAVALSSAVALPLVVRSFYEDSGQVLFTKILSVVLIVYVIAGLGIRSGIYGQPWQEHLPLHLCGAAAVLGAFMLWLRSFFLYEIVYFWGTAGSLVALLTPDLQEGFPHPFFLLFFIGHGLTFCAVMSAIFILEFRPQPASIVHVLFATGLFALLIFPVNLLLDSNYLYLMAKPGQASLLDYFGPWPWYIVGLAIGTVAGCLLSYLPFALRGYCHRRRISS